MTGPWGFVTDGMHLFANPFAPWTRAGNRHWVLRSSLRASVAWPCERLLSLFCQVKKQTNRNNNIEDIAVWLTIMVFDEFWTYIYIYMLTPPKKTYSLPIGEFKSSQLNERQSILIKTKNDHYITCVQIAGLIARIIVCYVKEGDEVISWQKYGIIKFGSRVDLYLPSYCGIKVAVGQRVIGAETTLADLEDNNNIEFEYDNVNS